MKQSPLQNDVVSFNVYDAFGREVNKYLPYTASTNDGNYKATAMVDGYNFNNIQYPGDQYYYGQANFEASPLDRVVSTMSPGISWVGGNKGVSNQYLINSASDSVRIWAISSVQRQVFPPLLPCMQQAHCIKTSLLMKITTALWNTKTSKTI